MKTVKLRQYFDFNNGMFPSIRVMNMRLSPESFDGVSRILKVKKVERYTNSPAYEGLLAVEGNILIYSKLQLNVNINAKCTMPNNEYTLFADDAAFYATSFSRFLAVKKIQNQLPYYERYLRRWRIILNIGKRQ